MDARRVEASRDREESGDEKDQCSSVGVWGGEGEGTQAAPGSGIGSTAALYCAGSLPHEACDVEAQGHRRAKPLSHPFAAYPIAPPQLSASCPSSP